MKNDLPQKNDAPVLLHENRENGFMAGILFIFAGAILLLNTTGYVGWDIWDVLARFWPVLLITGGLDMLIGRTIIGKAIAGIITALIFLAISAYALSSVSPFFDRWVRSRFPLWPVQQKFLRRFMFPDRRGLNL